ncbi:MAG TPA: alanine racemase [Synergistales bacterium]|nr:alanine racemase [Synergistales bacterium]
MNRMELDTPALMVDLDRMEANMKMGQEFADSIGASLRPHIKTHRTPAIALKQLENGARGITVAKVGEAEVMAEAGIDDIFIANEIVGQTKLERLRSLAGRVRLAVGVDNPVHVEMISRTFLEENRAMDVMIDVDTGDPRTGIKPGKGVLELAQMVLAFPGVNLRGIYTHDGQSYEARNVEEIREIFRTSQKQMLETAELLRSEGIDCQEISVGSTPSMLVGEPLEGVTEVRPGTYIFLDADQANVIGSYAKCALTVLGTVISRPVPERVVLDTGTKALTYFVQPEGITGTPGFGVLKDHTHIRLYSISDEHGCFIRPEGLEFNIGEKVEIIPNHACPTCNLYDRMYCIRNGEVVDEWPILARGRSQ